MSQMQQNHTARVLQFGRASVLEKSCRHVDRCWQRMRRILSTCRILVTLPFTHSSTFVSVIPLIALFFFFFLILHSHCGNLLLVLASCYVVSEYRYSFFWRYYYYPCMSFWAHIYGFLIRAISCQLVINKWKRLVGFLQLFWVFWPINKIIFSQILNFSHFQLVPCLKRILFDSSYTYPCAPHFNYTIRNIKKY